MGSLNRGRLVGGSVCSSQESLIIWEVFVTIFGSCGYRKNKTEPWHCSSLFPAKSSAQWVWKSSCNNICPWVEEQSSPLLERVKNILPARIW